MKLIRKNIPAIISVIFLTGYTIFGMILYYKEYNRYNYLQSYEQCLSDHPIYTPDHPFYNTYKASCDDMAQYEHLTDDTYTIFYQVFKVYDPTMPLVYIMPLFVIIPAIWQTQKEISSNYARNYLTRNNYKSYFKRMVKNVYKNAWILPVYCLIIFIVSYIFSGHFDYSFAVDHSIATYSLDKLQQGGLFFVGFIINILIHSLFYSNLALICARKNKNVILTILETFLLWYGIVLAVEIMGGILVRIGVIKPEYSLIFALINIYSLDETPNIIFVIIFGLICFAISSIVLRKVYKNKEKNIICWER